MILEPPPQYNHPYAGPVAEYVWRAPQVDAYCREAGAAGEGQIIGCQFTIGGRCFIVLSSHVVKLLRKHEIAHCNGWSKDHTK